MRILIGEDDPVSRLMLEATLRKWDYDVESVEDGDAALARLKQADAPSIAVLDWMMPGLDGVDVCRLVRAEAAAPAPYLILLTTKSRKEDLVEGLQAGADDYVTKPFDRDELRARLQVGVRVVTLQRSLADRVAALQIALTRVKQLQGLLPICSYCKKIRNDDNYWQQVEGYISSHTDVRFSHGICPDCFTKAEAEIEQMGELPSKR
jgi:phosphoserine phosphatase RsbU/P